LLLGKSANREFTFSAPGRRVIFQASASCVTDNLNSKLGLVIVARDITEHKNMENQILSLYETEKAQRHELEEEAKTRMLFLDVLGHELRNPLTPIAASAAMLNDIYASQPDNIPKKLAVNIEKGTKILTSRLDELLDLARFSRGAITLTIVATDPCQFVKEVAARFSPSLETICQKLVVQMPEKLPVAEFDPSRLEQVLLNLLSNASKYSRGEGDIILTAGFQEDNLLIQVQDSGIGISIEDQARLFQPYYRVNHDHSRFSGLGLGLAVSKKIVEAHHGEILVVSQVGKGSTFSVKIPLTQPVQTAGKAT
jgi:signal transduction histidine kinase